MINLFPAETPSGKTATFFTSNLPGLDTALGVLKGGFVIVGNLPNVGGTVGQGALQILNAKENRKPAEIRFGKGEDVNSIGGLADRLLKAFLRSDLANPKGIIIGIEEELRGPVIGNLPDLLARLDLVVDVGDAVKVIDFKTSRSQWDQDQVVSSADQLLLYSELVHPMADGRPVHLEFMVLTKTKFPTVSSHPVEYNSRQVERTKRIVERVWHAIEDEHFYQFHRFNAPLVRFANRARSGHDPIIAEDEKSTETAARMRGTKSMTAKRCR